MEDKKKYKILLCEDDSNLGLVLKNYLELDEYDVTLERDGRLGLAAFQREKFDLCLLDVMMPHVDGFTLAEEIRDIDPEVPLFFLSAKTLKEDIIHGYKLGADDYITKPFDLEELLLRIQNVLKHNYPKKNETSIFKFENGEINFSTFQVITKEGKIEDISKREMALLKLLTDNINNVVSRDEILDKLWAKDEVSSSRTIDNYILNFRKLFEKNPKEPIHFLSIRGVGYKFCV